MLRKQRFDSFYEAPVGELFLALAATLSFRRWGLAEYAGGPGVPARGRRYRARAGSAERTGRVVEIIKPVAMTLKEVLDDPPCRVGLTIRWRIVPLDSGCRVLLCTEYRLNRAAMLRWRHWDRRLAKHFSAQFDFLAGNLAKVGDTQGSEAASTRQNVI